MIRLSAATVLLQWAVGGMLFLWVTTRRREVSLGYGWLLRSVYLVMAIGAFAAGRAVDPDLARDLAALAFGAATGVALAVSIARRKAGVAGQRERQQRRRARVAAMTGVDRDAPARDPSIREFPPALDLLASLVGPTGSRPRAGE